MSSFYDDASLVVIPSGYKTSKVYAEKPTDGSGDLAFTRTGDTATRVNSAGVIEKVRTNYARQSQSFATAAAWTATNGTLTNNAGTAPDGTNTASKIVATNTDPFCYQSITLTGPVVASCYLKAVGSAIGKSAEIRAGVSLTAFTLSGSWQRVSVTHTASAAHNYGLEVPNPGVIGDEVLLWGFQVEGGDVATDYIPTTTAAVSVGPTANTARLDYLGSTCPRLLLEPQRTNLVTYSEQLDNAAWGKTNITITANNATSPDGYQNADTCLADGVNAVHIIASNLISFTSGTAYSFSVFAKKGTNNFMQLIISSTVGGMFANFDLNNGTVGTLGTLTGTTPTSSIVDYGNGWYRCTMNFTPTLSTSAYANFVIVTSASAARAEANTLSTSVILWGAQCEAGAYPTSYIPTLAASATRGADACSKTGISSLIGQSNGWIYGEVEGLTNSYGSKSVILSVNDGSSLNRVELSFNPTTGYITARIYKAGSTIFVIDYFKNSLTTQFKFAIGYGDGRAAFYVNGTKIHEVTSLTFFTSGTLTKVSADNYNGGEAGFGRVSTYLIGTSNLTNAELAELTTL